jgi:hypothetical protein
LRIEPKYGNESYVFKSMPRNSVFGPKNQGPDFLKYSPNKDAILPTNQGVTINKGRNQNLNKLSD